MATDQKAFPAYAPFDTLSGFMGTLKQTALPSHIDKSLMRNMSGSLQSHLMASLKFLKLIDPAGVTQPALRKLVDAHGTESWKSVLGEVLDSAYAPIIGDLDVSTTSSTRFRDRFKETTGLDGATLPKAMRFYVKAQKAAGRNVSPHILARQATGPGKPKGGGSEQVGTGTPGKPKTKQTPPRENGGGEFEVTIPDGYTDFPLSAKGRVVIVPKDLTAAEAKKISRYLAAFVEEEVEE